MKSIFLKECRFSRKMLILWASINVLMVIFFAAEYPMVAGSVEELHAIMDILPSVMGIMMGVYPEISIADPVGFFYCLFLWCALVANFYAAVLGAGLLTMDEKYKTAEFIYTKPFSRKEVITAKLGTGIFNISIITIVTGILLLIFMNALIGAKGLNGRIILCMLGLFGSEIIFMSIGLMFSSLLKKSEHAMRYAALTVLASYILSVVIKSTGADFLTFLSPFWYFNAPSIMTGIWNPLYLVLAATIVSVSIWLTYKKYSVRDL